MKNVAKKIKYKDIKYKDKKTDETKNLLELRKSNWVKLSGGPKPLALIRKEFINEEIQK